jgi:hypothetical protein
MQKYSSCILSNRLNIIYNVAELVLFLVSGESEGYLHFGIFTYHNIG